MGKVSLHPPGILHSAPLPSILLFMAQKSNETTWDVNPRKSGDINYLSHKKPLCHPISLHHQRSPCFILWLSSHPSWLVNSVKCWLVTHCIPMSWVNFGVQNPYSHRYLFSLPNNHSKQPVNYPFGRLTANRSPTNGTNLKMIVLFSPSGIC